MLSSKPRASSRSARVTKGDSRRFVGAGLEGEAEQADPLPPARHDRGDGPLDDGVVAGQQLGQEGRGQPGRLGQGQKAAQILGQAGAAEGEARAEIGGRDVEQPVFVKQAEDLARVDAMGGEHGAGLIGEGDLDRVIEVAEIFDALGRAASSPGAAPIRVKGGALKS